MSCFDEKLLKKDIGLAKTLTIDENLYNKLEDLSENVYDASVTKLVNVAILDFIATENIKVYKRASRSYVARSFIIREGAFRSLEELKDKYNLSISRLINIAIRNALTDLENESTKKE